MNCSVFCLIVVYCIWFMWQDFGSRGAAVVASVRKHQKFPPGQTESVSASSNTDFQLVKVKPISDISSASVRVK